MATRPTYDAALDAAARTLILDAVRAANGEIVAARAALGLPHRRMYREIERLGLASAIERIRAEVPRAA
jgi:transcriptional regulator of acetoin/glycerol metabolism